MKSHSLRKWIAVWIIFTWVGTTTIATITEISNAQTAKKVPVSKPATKTTKKNPKRPISDLDREATAYKEQCTEKKKAFSIRSSEAFNKNLTLLKFPTETEWSSVNPFPPLRHLYADKYAPDNFMYYFEINTKEEWGFINNINKRSLKNVIENLKSDLNKIKNRYYQVLIFFKNPLVPNPVNVVKKNFQIVIKISPFCQEDLKQVREFHMKIAINKNANEKFIKGYFDSKNRIKDYGI